jgi:hypothetical protein
MPKVLAITLLTIGGGLIQTNSRVARWVGVVMVSVVLLAWLVE